MRRMATVIIAATASVTLSGQADVAPSLDVVGIKIGMSVKEAATALKADNPRMMLSPSTASLEGFAQPMLLSIAGQENPVSGPNNTIARGAENLEILFTTPPNPEVVWGIKRVYTFATNERPDLQITIDAMRKKYGPETVAPSPDPRDQSKNMGWVYDAQGKPMGTNAASLYNTCAGLVTAHFGNGGNVTMSEIQAGRPTPAQCESISIVNAGIQSARLDPGNPQFVVFSLIVQITDARKHRAATDATRAVALAASKAREGKESEEVKKRGAPKL